MRAVQVQRLGGPEALRLVDLDEPEADRRVLVDVVAGGVAWPDLLRSSGDYQQRPSLPFTLGAEAAGVVRSAPPGCDLVPGQRVAAVMGHGAWQQTVAVRPDDVYPLPDHVPMTTGAGLALNYLTAHFALMRRARLVRGETVLVHGAAGGVGIATLHIAKAYGARTIAVVSTQEKAAAADAAGAHDVILADNFETAAKRLTAGLGVDIVLDPVGGDRVTGSLRALRVEGRLVVVGFTGGAIPSVKLNRLLLNNISVMGVGWSAFMGANPGVAQTQWARVVALINAGKICPIEPEPHPVERVQDVLIAMRERKLLRKAVIVF
ncbi:MAG TPA: NADPH:quinone oxidoreductase family protein [Nocardioides sp.]|nr:NADPH:quinone oxidoreductase family protein [Nocardioides sp.]